jgi:glycosyltransferase involved in cell wall biosynthesis
MDVYTPVELERLDADTMIFQRPYTDSQLAYLDQSARFDRGLRIFELDDLITQLPEKSTHRGTFPADLAARFKRAASLCHRLVASTQPLARVLQSWHEDVRVVPNRLPREQWIHLQPGSRQAGDRPRVGWAGALGHEGDLLKIAEVLALLAKEVDWVFLGHCPETLRQYIREIHQPVDIADYPARLASLNLDLAVAPLEINAFNEAKSNLKLLEYGILGYPVVCTDILPYQGDFPVTRVPNQPERWIRAIREHINDLGESGRRGATLREHVLAHWMLEDHLDEWQTAWMP